MLFALGSPRVLVAEDDPDIGCAMAEILQTEGYHVEVAASRLEACKLVMTEDFSLVITDLVWPYVRATRLAWPSTLRTIAAPTPVGICTAWPIDPRSIEHADFAFFLRKPFELDDLVTSAAQAIRAEPSVWAPPNPGDLAGRARTLAPA